MATSKLICIFALASSTTLAFRASLRREECCCRDMYKGATTCYSKKQNGEESKHFEIVDGENTLCCTIKAKGCPKFSKYSKKSVVFCEAAQATTTTTTTTTTTPLGLSGPGAYLTYTGNDKGTLITEWSTETKEDALAFIKPGKEVPKHKWGFRGLQKRRNTGDSSTPGYREGFASFVKSGKLYDGTLVVSPEADLTVIFLGDDDSITIVEPGVAVPLADKKIVVAVHKLNAQTFNMDNMSAISFYNKARDSQSKALDMDTMSGTH